MPSDEKQFESMSVCLILKNQICRKFHANGVCQAGHLAHTVIESLQENPFFRSPISKKAQHILDLGTGSGDWVCSLYAGTSWTFTDTRWSQFAWQKDFPTVSSLLLGRKHSHSTNSSLVTVHGVDLYPPPQKWVPPNCILEVDDFTKARGSALNIINGRSANTRYSRGPGTTQWTSFIFVS